MLRAFLFDFDGTLFDTEPLHFRAFAAALGRRGIMLERERYDERYLGLPDREAIARAIDDFGRGDLGNERDTIFREKSEDMKRLLAAGAPLFAGVARFVAAAAERGSLAIVSGAQRREIEAVLRTSSIERMFPVIVAAEDVRAGKPAPEGFLRALDGLRQRTRVALAPGECLAIEDAPDGVRAARAAGLRVLAVTHSRPREALASADVVVAGYDAVDWRDLEALFTTPPA